MNNFWCFAYCVAANCTGSYFMLGGATSLSFVAPTRLFKTNRGWYEGLIQHSFGTGRRIDISLAKIASGHDDACKFHAVYCIHTMSGKGARCRLTFNTDLRATSMYKEVECGMPYL